VAVRVVLVGVGGVDLAMLAEVARKASRALPLPSEWLVAPERLEPPMEAYNWERMQFHAGGVNSYISRVYGDLLGDGVKVVGVVGGDGYVEGMNFVFGLAEPHRGVATVYTSRLEGKMLSERLVKEVLHELGHLLGLGHCSNPRCVMNFSVDLRGVDSKEARFCEACEAKLRKLLGSGRV
jgi:archaemetzincin